MPAMSAKWWVLLALLCNGCALRVGVTSAVNGTRLTLPDGTRMDTPTFVKVPYRPFGKFRVEVSADGYRSYLVDLQRRQVRAVAFIERPFWWVKPKDRAHLSVMLHPVQDHGPAGSWSIEDVPH